ncbi:unnamed protein product, partial [Prunus brigantina]
NAGATYQRLVNHIFAELIGTSMEVYVDDMLVKSRTANDHLRNLSLMFGKLKQYSIRLKPSKCAFSVASGKFLGYRRQRRRFRASQAESPPWPDSYPKPPIAAPPSLKPSKEANGRSIGLPHAIDSVLIRQPNGIELPIFYMSHALQDAEQRYPQLEQLAYALILSARRLRPYFQAHSINVLTNQPLRQVLQKPETSGRLIKWAIELGEFDICYHPRPSEKGQAVADFISKFTI